eukprot:11218485-Lingulodinium_polyedra.AAC.1
MELRGWARTSRAAQPGLATGRCHRVGHGVGCRVCGCEQPRRPPTLRRTGAVCAAAGGDGNDYVCNALYGEGAPQ